MTCSPVAYDMRDQLLYAFRFAFRKDPVLLIRVAVIAHWTGHANMIRYLNDLAVLEQANTKSLSAIWFDLSLLDTAVTTATEMAELSAHDQRRQGRTERIQNHSRQSLRTPEEGDKQGVGLLGYEFSRTPIET